MKSIKKLHILFSIILFVGIWCVVLSQPEQNCPPDYTGDGKHVAHRICEWHPNGLIKKVDCQTSIYIMDNTLECCCQTSLEPE